MTSFEVTNHELTRRINRAADLHDCLLWIWFARQTWIDQPTHRQQLKKLLGNTPWDDTTAEPLLKVMWDAVADDTLDAGASDMRCMVSHYQAWWRDTPYACNSTAVPLSTYHMPGTVVRDAVDKIKARIDAVDQAKGVCKPQLATLLFYDLIGYRCALGLHLNFDRNAKEKIHELRNHSSLALRSACAALNTVWFDPPPTPVLGWRNLWGWWS